MMLGGGSDTMHLGALSTVRLQVRESCLSARLISGQDMDSFSWHGHVLAMSNGPSS
jgi:hypothetical protein